MTTAEQAQYIFRHLLEDVKAAASAETKRIGADLTTLEYRREVMSCLESYRAHGVVPELFEVAVRYDYYTEQWVVECKPVKT